MTLSADDRLAILELDARYCHAADGGDIDALLDLFTEDGGIERGGALVRGREGFAALAGQLAARYRMLRHWTANHVTDGDGDAAAHRCYWLTIHLVDGRLAILGTGTYEDELVKTAAGWQFRRRRIQADWLTAPTPAPPE